MATDLWARVRHLFGRPMRSRDLDQILSGWRAQERPANAGSAAKREVLHPMKGWVMESDTRSPYDDNLQGRVRHPAHSRIQGKVNIPVAALVATGTAGFLIGGPSGATAAVIVGAAVVIAWWRLQGRNPHVRPRPAEPAQPSAYADIEEVIDRLEDVARERNWDLAKRLDIARMACEDRSATVDELERRYDQQHRSAPDSTRQNTPDGSNNDASA